MLNSSSQMAQIFFSFPTVGTKWASDQENINIDHDDGAPGDVIVELPLAAGAVNIVSDRACTLLTN